jgi:hypothetical protein
MATDSSNKLSFPKPTITAIASRQTCPTYASLKIAQSELNGNAASIHTNLGGGQHGHIALIITEAEFLRISATAFVPPINPPPMPNHADNATTVRISENNRQHLENQKAFNLYLNVDKELKNQIIASLPDTYIREMKHSVTGYGNVTSLALMTHLWDNYGAITQADLKANMQRMQLPWNPPTPIEDLFIQLEEGRDFANDGEETIANTTLVRMGYEIIEANGLFELPCREWRQKATAAERTFTRFKAHFRTANTDRKSTATTGTSGYDGAANQAEVAAEPTQAEIIATAVKAAVESALAAREVTPANNNSNNGRVRETVYCWTHGVTRNLRHTSLTCEHRDDGHKEEATKDNKMGGSEKINGRRTRE